MDYKLLKKLDNYFLLEIKPQTGRHHQIRVQLANIGCIIKGDLKYGANSSFGDGRRIALHAARLELPPPTREERICISSDADFWPTSLPE